MERFIQISRKFFAQVGGEIKDVYHTKRKNIEILGTLHEEKIDVCCIEVEFINKNIFGNTTYMNAYRGYRQMRNDWWQYLKENGYEQWDINTKIIGHFVPLLAQNNTEGEIYTVQNSTSYGEVLTKFDISQSSNQYYKEIHDKYGIEWLLEDGNKIAIGPDVGLFLGMIAYVETFGAIDSFLDVGTGTGELSAYLIKNNLVRHITANEISEKLKEHIITYLSKHNQDEKVSIDYQFRNALEMQIPNKIDLLSLGIYYGAQPDYFKNFGKYISEYMSENGMVIIQSGMLEGRFNISSIIGDDKRLYDWDWYSKDNTLSAYFSYVDSVFVADEVVTIATNNEETMNRIKETMFTKLNACSIPELQKIEM